MLLLWIILLQFNIFHYTKLKNCYILSQRRTTFRKRIYESNAASLTLFHNRQIDSCSSLNKINTVTIATSYIPFHFPLHSIQLAAHISVFWLSLQLHSTITSLRMKYGDRFHLSRCSLSFVKEKHRKVCSIANINWRHWMKRIYHI